MYERFLELLNEKGIKTAQVAKATNIHPSMFSDWKKGKSSPKIDKLQKIANYFGVRVEYLTGESDYKTDSDMWAAQDKNAPSRKKINSEHAADGPAKRIPVLGHVAAGIPISMIEDVIDWEEIPHRLAQRGSYFGLQVKGDSMSPRIAEGDVLIVRQQDDAETGDIVIVTVNGDSATCKRLEKCKDGISLISFNPLYKPIHFSNQEIETKPVRIIGKVVENRQKY